MEEGVMLVFAVVPDLRGLYLTLALRGASNPAGMSGERG